MFDLLLEKLNDVHVITGFLISLILCFSFAKIYMFIIKKSGLIKKENKEENKEENEEENEENYAEGEEAA